MKERIMNLSNRDKTIIAFWLILFAVLAFHSMRFPRSELEENCADFVRKNGCYLSEEEIRELDTGQRLYELIEGTAFDSPKEACGCVTYNITEL